YATEYGADTRDQSSLNLVYLLGSQSSPGNFSIFGGSDERFHIRGGNELLPVAVAGALPAGTVVTGYRLTRIVAQAAGTVALTLQVGSQSVSVVADRVILPLPFAVLRDLDTSRAGFDTLKQRAIRELGRGRNGKLMVQFSERLWNTPGAWGIGTGSTYSDL